MRRCLAFGGGHAELKEQHPPFATTGEVQVDRDPKALASMALERNAFFERQEAIMTRYLDARQPNDLGQAPDLTSRIRTNLPVNRILWSLAIGAAGRADEKRYQVAVDAGDTWQVIDTMTNLSAASNGREFVQLGKKDAQDLADELNACEAEGRESPLV